MTTKNTQTSTANVINVNQAVELPAADKIKPTKQKIAGKKQDDRDDQAFSLNDQNTQSSDEATAAVVQDTTILAQATTKEEDRCDDDEAARAARKARGEDEDSDCGILWRPIDGAGQGVTGGTSGTGITGGTGAVGGGTVVEAGTFDTSLLAFGALGLTLAGGISRYGASSSAVTGPTSGIKNLLQGEISAGPVLNASDDLIVAVYKADGSFYKSVHVNSDGTYRVDLLGYTGLVVAKVFNQTAASDYMDEATGQMKNLSADLMGSRACKVGTNILNLNAVTTIAAKAAGIVIPETMGDSATVPDATIVATANINVANAFGLSDITGTKATTTVDTSGAANSSFNAADGLSASEKLGLVLAALSGADKKFGGNSQAVIDEIVKGMTGDGTLTAAAQTILIGGAVEAATTNGGVNAQLVGQLLAGLDAAPDLATLQGQSVLTVAQLAAAGITDVNAQNLESLAAILTSVTTLAQLQDEVTSAVASTLDRIKAAAENNDATNADPRLEDYAAAGVVGVDAANLGAINDALNSAYVTGALADTREKVQAVVEAYRAILAEANGVAADKDIDPTAAQYTAIGVTGVSSAEKASLLSDIIDVKKLMVGDVDTVAEVQALANRVTTVMAGQGVVADYTAIGVNGVADGAQADLLADVIKSKAPDQVDTVAEIQALADAVAAVVMGAAGGTGPTKVQLEALGIVGVTDSNLATVSANIANTNDDGSGINTIVEIQALVNSVALDATTQTAVDKIRAEAADANSVDPELADYAAAGVSGVTADNLAAINDALDSDHVTAALADTTPEVQIIVDAYKAILAEANGSSADAGSDPSAAQYTAIGVTGIDTAPKASLLSDIIDVKNLDAAAVDTVAEVQALANAVTKVMAAADGRGNNNDNNPTATDYAMLGVVGIDADAKVSLLGDVIDAKAATGVDTVAEIQLLANAVIAVMDGAAGKNSGPTQDQLQALGITGITDENLADVQAAIAATVNDGTAVDTLPELQALVKKAINNDSTAPTCTITTDTDGTVIGNVTFTFKFSEVVTGFTADDVVLDAGAKGAFTRVSGDTYTLVVTPPAGKAGDITVDVATGSFSDIAGNINTVDVALLRQPYDLSATLQTDTTGPAVTSIAITSAAGAQNSTLNPGDVITVTVKMDEATLVSGTPQLALDIGTTTVQANYVAGSGSKVLTFQYTIQSGQADTNGISIAANQITLNSGTMKDGNGNNATLIHDAITDNSTYKVDTTGPAAPTLAELSTTDIADGQMSAAEAVTTTFQVTLTSTSAVAGDTVELLLGSAPFGMPKTVALTAADITKGYIDFTVLNTDLGTDGAKSLSAKITDMAGNVGVASNILTFTLDRTAPAVSLLTEKTTTDLADGKMTEAEAQDTTFSVSLPSGAAVGDKVELLLGSSAFGTPKTIILSASDLTAGTVDFTVNKADLGAEGEKSLTAKITDAAGNVGAASNALNFVLDTTGMALTLVEQGSTDLADGMMNADEALSTIFRVALPSASGNNLAVANDKVQLLLGADSIGSSKSLSDADVANGYVDFTVLKADLGADGAKSLSASLMSSADAIKTTSNKLLFALDATALSAPTLAEKSTTDIADGIISAAEAVTTTFSVTLPTGAVVGDTVQLLLDGDAFSTPKTITLTDAMVVANKVDFTLLKADLGTDGAKSLSVIVTDVAGNTSSASNALDFILDTAAPLAPTLAEKTTTDILDGKMNAAEAATTTFSASLPSGAAVGDKVELLLGGHAFATPKIVTLTQAMLDTQNVDFTVLKIDLGTDGVKSLTAKMTDVAGNVGTVSNVLSFTLDTTAVSAPTLAELETRDIIDGTMNVAEAITTTFRITLPTAGSKAAVGDSVELLLGDTAFDTPKIVKLTATDVKNGTVDFTVLNTELGTDGAKSLTAKITDSAGNAGDASNALAFTLNTSRMALSEAASMDLADDKMNAAEAATTVFRVTLGMDKTAVAGDIVQLLLDGVPFATAKTAALSSVDIENGYVDFSVLKGDLGIDGLKSLTATLSVSGATTNKEASINALVFTLDTTAPAAPTLSEKTTSDLADKNVNAAEAVTTTFAVTLPHGAVVGDTVELLLNDSSFGTPKTMTLTTAMVKAGSVDFTVLKADLGADGEKSLAARLIDGAGNPSDASDALAFTLDTSTPAPTINVVTADNRISATEKTAEITGAAEPGATVTLTLGDGNTHQVTADGAGNWTYHLQATDIKAMGEGLETLQAIATDALGNVSATTARTIMVDTLAPAAPVLSELTTSDLSDGKMSAAEAVTTTFRVALPTTGSVAVAGDSVELLLGGAAFSPAYHATLSGADISNGYVDFNVIKDDLGSDGAKSLTAQVTDVAGNAGALSNALGFTLDTVTPTPTINLVTLDDKVNANEQTAAITGTAEAGATVTLTLGDGNTHQVTADDSGNWTYALQAADLTAMGQGPETISAMATDMAGNVSATAATHPIVIDTVSPAVSSLAITSATGAQNSTLNVGDVLNVTVTMSESTVVTGVPQLALNMGGTTVQAHYLSGSGSTELVFQYTVLAGQTDANGIGIADGSTTSQITLPTGSAMTDSSGNNAILTHAAITDNDVYKVDTTAPNAPLVAPDMTAATDSGSSDADNITSDNTPTFTILALPDDAIGGTVQLLVDGVVVAASYDSVNNTLTPLTALADGEHAVTYQLVDAAGNIGLASPVLTATIDTIKPAAPAAPDMTSGTDAGRSDTDDNTSDTTPTFTIDTLPAGVTSARLLVDGAVVDAVYDSENHTLTPVDPLINGAHDISYQFVDVAGNISDSSAALSMVVDTLVPAGTTIAAPSATTLSGTCEEGAVVMVQLENGTALAATVTGTTWTYQLLETELSALRVANKTVTVIATDAAGNEATVNTITTPTMFLPPVITEFIPGDGMDISNGLDGKSELNFVFSEIVTKGTGNIVIQDITDPAHITTFATIAVGDPQIVVLDLQGNLASQGVDIYIRPTTALEQGHQYRLTMDAGSFVDLGGSVFAGLTATAGTTDGLAGTNDGWNFSAVAATIKPDFVAGDNMINASEAAAVVTIQATINSSAAVVAALVPSDISLTITENGTSNTVPVTITAYDPATGQVSATVAADAWTTGATYTYALNVSGSTGAAAGITASYTFTHLVVDTSGPTQTVAINSVTDDAGTVTGVVLTNGATDDTTPYLSGALTGTLGEGEHIAIYRQDGNATPVLITSANGLRPTGVNPSWSFTDTGPLVDGHTYTYTARVEDAAGNQGPASTAYVVTVDTSAPTTELAAPDLHTDSDWGSSATDDKTSDNTPGFTVTAPVGTDTVQLLIDGKPVAATLVGTTLTPDNPLADGNHIITYRHIDAAGNVGSSSSALPVTIDTAKPMAPLAAPDMTSATDLGTSSTDNATKDQKPDFTVTAPPVGETVELLVDGQKVAATYADGALTPTAGIPDGPHTIAYRYVDTAGNFSDASPVLVVNIDATPPTAPLLSEKTTTDTADGKMNATEAVTTTFSVTLPSGSLAGDTVELLSGGSAFGTPKTVTLTSNMLTTGHVDFTILQADLGTDGAKSLTAKISDVAGNATLSNVLTFTLDTAAPDAPTLAEQGSTDLADNLMEALESVTTDFRVTLPTTGALPVAGDTVELLLGGSAFGTPKTVTLSQADVINGYVDFTVLKDDLGAAGDKSLTAKVIDASGNPGSLSNALAFTLDTTPPDTTAPTLVITDNKTAPLNIAGGDITYTFDFGEAVTGFTIDDIVVAHGAKGTFTAVSSSQYTLVVTPSAGYEGNVTVDVAAAAATDLANNDSVAATQSTQAVDRLAPTATMVKEIPTVVLGAGNTDLIKGIYPEITQIGTEGAYVATWLAQTSGSTTVVMVQKFNPDGSTTGNALIPLTSTSATGVTAESYTFPQVAAVGTSGAYAVTWTEMQLNGGYASRQTFVQQFNADGSTPTRVTLDVPNQGGDELPEIISLGASGKYLVTWQVNGYAEAYIQKFNADGTVDGSSINLGSLDSSGNGIITVTTLGDTGDFVVAWNDNNGGKVQKFYAAGPEESAVTLTAGYTHGLDITAIGNAGQFVVAWNNNNGTDYAQKFTANGQKDGAAIAMPGVNDKAQVLGIGTAGAFAVAGTYRDSDGDPSVFVQTFNADGTKQPMVTLEAIGRIDGIDWHPRMAAVGSQGDFVVTWQGTDNTGATGDNSIFVQKFNSSGEKVGTTHQIEAPGRTNGEDTIPRITAVGTDGSFAVTWQGQQSNSAYDGAFVQQFNADGLTVKSSEVGKAYLVKDSITVTDLASIEGTATDLWNVVDIVAANTNTPLALTGLTSGTYKLYTMDAAGNLSAVASDTILVNSVVVADTTPPTCTISSSAAGTTATGDITYTFKFSEAIDGFTVDDVSLNTGTKGAFTKVDDNTYTLVVSPLGGTAGTMLVDVATGSFTDKAATPNANTSNTVAIRQAFNAPMPTNLSLDTNNDGIADLKLINKATTSTGKTYYFLDADGNGSASSADSVAHDWLDNLLNGAITANTVDTTVSAGVDDLRTMLVNGYTIVLPTKDELLALYNDPLSNPPPGWGTGLNYHSSTVGNGAGYHANVNMALGTFTASTNDSVDYKRFVTFEVLPPAPIVLSEPSVSSIAITAKTGAMNNTLNAGDTVTVTVNMSEATTVTGTPQLALNIGGTTVQANYAGGTGTTALTFTYTIASGQTDTNGISIDAGTVTSQITLNGGTLKNATDTDAVLTHNAVTDNASYLVDTTAPTATISAASVIVGANVQAKSSELGKAYLVKDDVTVSNLADIIGNGSNVAAKADNLWNAVDITAINADTMLSTTGLTAGGYKLYTADAAGNLSLVSSSSITVTPIPGPTISSVDITAQTGAVNNTLNAGDTVTVTVNMSEATTVITTGGTPTLALNIGGTTVQANYAGGTGTTALTFTYTIASGQTDTNGISIDAGTTTSQIALNGGALRNAAGGDATLIHSAVTDNASYLVDSLAPTPTLIAEMPPIKIAGDVFRPRITEIGSDGQYVVSWAEQLLTGNVDQATGSLPFYNYAQVFNADGSKFGAQVQLSARNIGYDGRFNVTVQTTAFGDAGDFLAYWYEPGAKDSAGNYAVTNYVRHFTAAGVPVGNEIVFNKATTADSSKLGLESLIIKSVADLGNGQFVVAWGGADPLWNPGWSYPGTGYAQVYNADGTVSGTRASTPQSTVVDKVVSIGSDGSYAVIGTLFRSDSSKTFYVQKFNADGTPEAPVYDSSSNTSSSYAMTDTGIRVEKLGTAGDFLVMWDGANGSNYDLAISKFSANGTQIGSKVAIASADFFYDVVTFSNSTGYAVTWKDKSDGIIRVELFNADNVGGTVVQLAAPSLGGTQPQIAAVGNNGEYVVVFNGQDITGVSPNTTSDSSLFIQRFNADGTKNGTMVMLESDSPTGSDMLPQVSAVGDNGAFAVTWYSQVPGAGVGSYSINVQQFNADGTTGISVVRSSGGHVVVKSSEVGMAYLVDSSVTVHSLTDITGASDNQWNSIAITAADTNTDLAATGLATGTYKLYTVDAAGNLSAVASATMAIDSSPIDTSKPVVTSGATGLTMAENTAAGTLVYTATATDTDALGANNTALTYSLKGADAALFNINATTGAVTFKASPDYDAPLDSGKNNTYDFTVVAADATGNKGTQAVSLAVTNVIDPGEAVIVLGTNPWGAVSGMSASANLGQLIKPVQVESKWYYYWDISGDGTSAGADDKYGHDTLNAIFKYDINGVVGTGTTDVYRYATMNVTIGGTDYAMKLALPTYGGAVNGSGNVTGNSTTGTANSGTGTAVNTTYNDLLAIRDAFDGASVLDSIGSVPAGWHPGDYISATKNSADNWAEVALRVGDNSVWGPGNPSRTDYIALELVSLTQSSFIV